MSNPNPGFTLESWILYGVGATCVLFRLYVLRFSTNCLRITVRNLCEHN